MKSSESLGERLFDLSASQGLQLWVFDLDDTLIAEIDYLRWAYRKMGMLAASGDMALGKIMSAWLLEEFLTRGRVGLFDRFRIAFPGCAGQDDEWLWCLRSARVPGGLPVADWALRAMADTAIPCCVLTNGNTDQQRNKFLQLSPPWVRSRMTLWLAADYRPKPAIDGMLEILGHYGVPASRTVFIGDSASDRECAETAGVHFLATVPEPP